MTISPFVAGPTALASAPQASDLRCFSVVVDKRVYGLRVECIQTVFEISAITPVPLAPYPVLGLVNLRGKIATAVSLRRILRADPRIVEPSRLAVGVDHGNEGFALIVDEVGDVLTLDRGTDIEVPPHLGEEAIKFSSVHRLPDQILPVLDLDWALAFGTEIRAA